MQKIFQRLIRREFGRNLGRFVSVAAIIAIAVGFVLGIMVSPSVLQRSMDLRLDELNTYDIRITSNSILTNEELDKIKEYDSTVGVTVWRSADMIVKSNEGRNYTARLFGADHQEPNGKQANESELIVNKLKVVKGRLPKTKNEVVVGREGSHMSTLDIGTRIEIQTVQSGLEPLINSQWFEVVGLVDSPLYYDRNVEEPAYMGGGSLELMLYTVRDAYVTEFFGVEVFSDIYLRAKGLAEMDSFDKAYFDKLAELEQEYYTLLDTEEDDEGILGDKQYFINGRTANQSFVNFYENTDKVRLIAAVFPPFFLIVAALVAMSAMTRMVEEDRGQIGTMKALGYRSGSIMGKYLAYGVVTAAIGSAVGVAVGFGLIPYVIYSVFVSIYYLPAVSGAGFVPWLALAAVGIAIVLTSIVTIATVLNTLKENASSLMRPRAPKAGKRILLERITPLWKRLPFGIKASLRNVFRHKKHFIMTVIGIAGCTALLLAGFGTSDSVTANTQGQYGSIIKYDLKINVSQPSNELEEVLSADQVQEWLPLYVASINAKTSEDNLGAQLFVVDTDKHDIAKFVGLVPSYKKETVETENNSMVVMSKMHAKALGVRKGDKVSLTSAGKTVDSVTITGVVDNYFGGFVYMGKGAYEQMFGSLPENNLIWVNGDFQDSEQVADLLNNCPGVVGFGLVSNEAANYDELLTSFYSIVAVIIITAGGLSVTVMYNLLNININERKREIAALKVLGYHDIEAALMVYREMFIMAIIGVGIGLGLGVLLHAYIALSVSTTTIMFGALIKPISYLISIGLNVVFLSVVAAVMYPKIKRISMSESMKSAD